MMDPTAAPPTDSPVVSIPADYVPPGARSHVYTLSSGLDAAKRMFWWDLDVGDPTGPDRPTYLFVHGNPESSYTYRDVVRALAAHHETSGRPARLVAIDHIGFGLSDQADFEMIEMHHAANLARFVDELDLSGLTLIVHDWGGPAGIGSMLDQPDRVDRLFVLNTSIWSMPRSLADLMVYTRFPIPVIAPWTFLARAVPWRWWRWVPPLVIHSPGSRAGFVRHAIRFVGRARRGDLTPSERHLLEGFTPRINALSSKRIARQTGGWGTGGRYEEPRHGVHDSTEFYGRLRDEIVPAWRHRVQVGGAFGRWDPLGKDAVREQWPRAFPGFDDRMQLFDGVGHFVEEHRADEIAAAVFDMTAIGPLDEPG